MDIETQDTLKVCRLCGTEKPIDEFYPRKDYGNHRNECKVCTCELARYRSHGVCNVKYDEMLVRQKGGCAICAATLGNTRYTRLAVDHCHKSGKVRGLLCSNCNTAIGLMKDSPKRMALAVEYLKRHQGEDIV